MRPPPIDLGAWQAPRGREHPLVGRIWDTQARRFVTREDVVAGLTGARYVLLGERHDHPDHHRVQAALVRALLAAGRRPAVVFEMFTADDSAGDRPPPRRRASRRRRAGRRRRLDALAAGRTGPTTSPSRRPRWTPACRSSPATWRHPPRERWLAATAARSRDGLAARYALDRPLPDGGQAALTSEILEAHCGHIPADRMDGMVLAQRARDAALAEACWRRRATAPC